MSEATIGDVARRAGVSTTTVSRFLAGQSVRAEESIRAAVQDLAYRPSPAARSLRSGRTRSIAVVVPDVTNPFFAAVVKGAEAVARQDEYHLFLSNTDENVDREAAVLADLVGRVDGAILAPTVESDEAPLRAQQAGLPIVFLDREIGGTGSDLFDSVLVDNAGGSRRAAEHLLDLGHRRIAIVNGTVNSTPGRQRREAFLETLQKVETVHVYEEVGDFREQGGYQAVMRLLALEHPPTALFVTNNLMTVGALRALHDLGIRVPDQLSIIGFDDLDLAALLMPPLTVVSRPMEEQGALAMRLLLRRLSESGDVTARRIVLETNLLVRGSTGPTPTHRRTT
ncbi:LacI family transcriptional regulator [Asanoa ishikariensis]|uniref:Transcriptional regulator, LacI family n=1 Tax=Asanoa ishikariensis TaxID=137265 RepID=A0A1H3UQL9_9ACTN|nr:LacI family DNA-binding transcriptional regulator [Asanoa ishikariensis]GIF69235.1 LacI family transcriptional regulator [Asanoa ishikariensis]SDZ64647.1 transcriptional regulator, LacI family [Asanoa ishikariensis]